MCFDCLAMNRRKFLSFSAAGVAASGLIGFGGGVPFAGGAIAVAGAPSQDTDERCARAGLAAMRIR